MEPDTTSDSSALIEVLAPIGLLIVVLAGYFLLCAVQGNIFLPFHWAPKILFSFTTFTLLAAVAYVFTSGLLSSSRFEMFLSRGTDLTAYKDLKPLDLLLTHYGNVATFGLLLGLAIYAGRHVAGSAPQAVAVLFGAAIMLLFFVYAVLYAKLAISCASRTNRLYFYLALAIGAFALDSIAIYFFIASGASVPLVGS